jgi:hypothetical protein
MDTRIGYAGFRIAYPDVLLGFCLRAEYKTPPGDSLGSPASFL